MNDILRKFIKKTLEFQGDHPEKYYDENVFTSKIEQARKKNRGIEFQVIPNYEIRQETLACISTSSFPSAFENTSSPTGNKRTSSPYSSTPTSIS